MADCNRAECVRMTSTAGEYVYVSAGRGDDLVDAADNVQRTDVVAVEFTDFDVDCDDAGLLVVRN